MRAAGFSAQQLDRARALWADFQDGRRLRVHKPESYAAAVEYAIACVQGMDGVTQTSVAKRYGIDRRTLASRYFQIRDALASRARGSAVRGSLTSPRCGAQCDQ